MNPIIRKLVVESGLDDIDFPIEDWDNVPLAKFAELTFRQFAELIICECIKLNSQELSISASERLLAVYQQHFGVIDE